MDTPQAQQERRAFPRAMITLPVIVSLNGRNGDVVYKGMMENISGGGLCLRLDRQAWEKQFDHSAPLLAKVLRLSIPLPVRPEPIAATGRIAWSMGIHVRQKEYYKVGVSFTEISEEERGAITSLVSQLCSSG